MQSHTSSSNTSDSMCAGHAGGSGGELHVSALRESPLPRRTDSLEAVICLQLRTLLGNFVRVAPAEPGQRDALIRTLYASGWGFPWLLRTTLAGLTFDWSPPVSGREEGRRRRQRRRWERVDALNQIRRIPLQLQIVLFAVPATPTARSAAHCAIVVSFCQKSVDFSSSNGISVANETVKRFA